MGRAFRVDGAWREFESTFRVDHARLENAIRAFGDRGDRQSRRGSAIATRGSDGGDADVAGGDGDDLLGIGFRLIRQEFLFLLSVSEVGRYLYWSDSQPLVARHHLLPGPRHVAYTRLTFALSLSARRRASLR